MKIRTQLRAAVVASVVIGLLAAIGVAGAARDEDVASDEQSRAQETAHEVSGLLVLTQDYARHAEARAAQQWRSRQGAIVVALAREEWRALDGPALKELRAVARAMPQLFDRLEDLSTSDDPFALRRKEVLLDQLLTSTQAMSDYAYQWYQEATAARQRAETRFQVIALATPLLMLAMLSSMAWLLVRRVLRPLERVEAAAAVVAAGDLTQRIGSSANDELGALSRRFDRMSEALADSRERQRRTEQELREVTENLPALVGRFDLQQRCLFANRTARDYLAIDPAALGTLSLREAVGEDSYAQHLPHLERVLRGQVTHFEGSIERKGREVHFRVHLTPQRDDGGEVVGFHSMTFDVTALRQAELARARTEERLRQITDNLPVLISYLDGEERLQFANETYRRWLGADPVRAIGRPLREVVGADFYAPRQAQLARALAGERVEFESSTETLGVPRTTRTSYIPDTAPDGSVRGVYALSTDVTALKEVQRQLQALARYDTLTGLPNRLQYGEKLPEALARAERSGRGLALMFLDIDRFKAINDDLGHAAGDLVLRSFAQRLRGSVRQTDTVVRLAGDEFVVILEDLHDDREPQLVARKLVEQMTLPIEIDGRPVSVTTSVGIGYQHRTTTTHGGDALLALADQALYDAKRAGRNTYRLRHADDPGVPGPTRH